MTYKVNGRVVTKEEFMKGARGITFGKAPMGISRQSFVSPVDGSIIKSASDLSAHERKHNIIQVGNEYVGIVNEKRAEQRELKSDMRRQVREAEKNGIQDSSNFKWQ